MTKRTRTPQDQDQWQAQRDERMSSLMQQLEAGVEAIQTSEDFKRYLRTHYRTEHMSALCSSIQRLTNGFVR